MNFSKNLDFGQNVLKISILVKMLENLDSGQNCRKIWIFGENYRKISIWSNLSEISILVKILGKSLILEFLLETSILLWIFDIGMNFRKISILSTIFFKILAKIVRNLNFEEYFRKISIFVKFSENLDFG